MFQFCLWGRRVLWSSSRSAALHLLPRRQFTHTHRLTGRHTQTHAHTHRVIYICQGLVNSVLQTGPFLCCLPLSSTCKHVSKSALRFFRVRKTGKLLFVWLFWARLLSVWRLLAISGRRDSASFHICRVNVYLIAFAVVICLRYRWCFPVLLFFHVAVTHFYWRNSDAISTLLQPVFHTWKQKSPFFISWLRQQSLSQQDCKLL